MSRQGVTTIDWSRLRGPDGGGVNVHRLVSHREAGPHDHLFHEIVYVEGGSAVHLTAAGRSPLRAGDVIVIRPQVWHGYENPHEFTIINCLIDSRLIARFGALLAEVPGAFDLYRRPAVGPRDESPTQLHARPAQAKPLVDRFEAIMRELAQERDGWRAAVAVGAMDVLVTCARLASGATTETPRVDSLGRAEQAVRDAVTYLESHYGRQVRLDDLARRVNLSPGHLSRSFTRYLGMNIVSFVHRLRAEEACRLLQATEQPISDIAMAVGYDEVAYFSRCFRAQLGISPTEYRRAGGRRG